VYFVSESVSQWPTERLVSALYRWLFHRHYICQDYVSLGDSTDGHWDMCIVEPYRPQPPCLVYSFGYHRCSFRPHRRHCKQCYEGPWFNSNLGALNSLCWPPRAKTGSPKCWEWRWGFEAQGPATGSGKRCKPPMPRVLTRGPPGAWGTSSLNRMNPRFLRHWLQALLDAGYQYKFCTWCGLSVYSLVTVVNCAKMAEAIVNHSVTWIPGSPKTC